MEAKPRLILAMQMSSAMVLMVTFLVTVLDLGLRAGFVNKWVKAYFLAWPVWRSQFLIEIWLTEGWNAYFQDAAASGARLYPEASSLTVNNYPPLSFYFVGLLGRLCGG